MRNKAEISRLLREVNAFERIKFKTKASQMAFR